MNSIEIVAAMLKDDDIRSKFKGVYSIDNIPSTISEDSLIIVNLDPSYKKGSHWVVLHYTEEGNFEHFDSLGRKPNDEIHNLLMINKIKYKYNNKRLQNFFTETCGLYCIYYSYFSCRNKPMEDILMDFSTNLRQNELIVREFYCTHFI